MTNFNFYQAPLACHVAEEGVDGTSGRVFLFVLISMKDSALSIELSAVDMLSALDRKEEKKNNTAVTLQEKVFLQQKLKLFK